jgi:predicted RecA/RadA family phage recombinase
MKNFIQRGETLTLIAPAAVASGDMVKVGQIHGVAVASAANGAEVEVVTIGVFELPKKPAEAINQGDLVYWDNANTYLTKTSAVGLTLVGVATASALAAATTVEARLNGIAVAAVAA